MTTTAYRPGDLVEISNYSPGIWVLAVVDHVADDGTLSVVCSMNRMTFAAGSAEVRPALLCDGCYFHPDGTRADDGTVCPCSIRPPTRGCRCQESQGEWLGPGYVRAEIAAEEGV